MIIKELSLKETSFEEFKGWVNENKNRHNYKYVTDKALRIIYDHYRKDKNELIVSGQNLYMTCGGEFNQKLSEPLEEEVTRDDLVGCLFHEIWCKTEWAMRCGRDPMALGYSSVQGTFGTKIIKELKQAA